MYYLYLIYEVLIILVFRNILMTFNLKFSFLYAFFVTNLYWYFFHIYRFLNIDSLYFYRNVESLLKTDSFDYFLLPSCKSGHCVVWYRAWNECVWFVIDFICNVNAYRYVYETYYDYDAMIAMRYKHRFHRFV